MHIELFFLDELNNIVNTNLHVKQTLQYGMFKKYDKKHSQTPR